MTYILKIYPDYIPNMSGDELGIQLKPLQGVTGKVCEDRTALVAQRLAEAEGGGWRHEYSITAELAKIIHPELKWIISMPLKSGSEAPIGVMCIDGLVHQFSVDKLFGMLSNADHARTCDL